MAAEAAARRVPPVPRRNHRFSRCGFHRYFMKAAAKKKVTQELQRPKKIFFLLQKNKNNNE